ncbi:2-methylbutanal oxime monooxygenase [Gossypium hirsutum]|uniref:2-methylbutanal oxime monooxygenase n=1 Tax=Gossypium hirsutum TaxID=3635 RepID=A0ABM3AZK9_GOSHI|nr:2-methylbutanal oxime monooxygenase-like [Gossypium hirsutum]
MTETYKDWHKKLPFALYAYRTSVQTFTGATPFFLVYGIEAVLPIEVEIPSLRVLMKSKLEESEWIRARYDQLNLIEGKCLKAICHGQMYKKRMITTHDKNVRPREFCEGELWLPSILFLTVLTFLLLKKEKNERMKGIKVPPGPPKLPLIGSFHLLGKFPHRSLEKLSKKYGSIMLLQLGSVPTVIVSSAKTAEQASPKSVNLNEKIFALADGIIGTIAFGKIYGTDQLFHNVLGEAMNMLDSFLVEDFFPMIGRIIDALTGLSGRLEKSFHQFDGYLQMVLDQYLDHARPKPEQEDLVDFLIRLMKDESNIFRVTENCVRAMLFDAFMGGIVTTSTTILRAMSELKKNPRVMNKVQAGIRNCIGKKAKVEG